MTDKDLCEILSERESALMVRLAHMREDDQSRKQVEAELRAVREHLALERNEEDLT